MFEVEVRLIKTAQSKPAGRPWGKYLLAAGLTGAGAYGLSQALGQQPEQTTTTTPDSNVVYAHHDTPAPAAPQVPDDSGPTEHYVPWSNDHDTPREGLGGPGFIQRGLSEAMRSAGIHTWQALPRNPSDTIRGWLMGGYMGGYDKEIPKSLHSLSKVLFREPDSGGEQARSAASAALAKALGVAGGFQLPPV